MPGVSRDGKICMLDLGDGENRFTPHWIHEVNGALDEIEATEGAAAVVTVASGKFWSYGLDLDWMASHPAQVDSFVSAAQTLFGRVLVFKLPTIAAIQGHAFAAGAMLALAHDHRVMRIDRGFICAPEVDIKVPFTRGMTALFEAKLQQPGLHQVLVTGRRYGARDAQRVGLVDDVVSGDELRSTALVHAHAYGGKDRTTLGAIKSGLYSRVVTALEEPVRVMLPNAL